MKLRHKEMLMVRWCLYNHKNLTDWEFNFMVSMRYRAIDSNLSIKQRMKLSLIYEKLRRPRQYYAGIWI